MNDKTPGYYNILPAADVYDALAYMSKRSTLDYYEFHLMASTFAYVVRIILGKTDTPVDNDLAKIVANCERLASHLNDGL